MNRRELLTGLMGAALGSTALASITSASASLGEKTIREATASIARRRNRFPNVVLRTHENKLVRFYDDLVKEKIVIVNFMYVGCRDGTCPLTTANLVEVQKLLGERLGRDIFIYSITLDPEHDTAAVLQRYAKSVGVKPGWLFLTGKDDDIEKLRKNLGFVDLDPVVDADKSQHIGVIKFGIEPLERWGTCPALTKPKWIAQYISWLEPQGERPNGRPKQKRASGRNLS